MIKVVLNSSKEQSKNQQGMACVALAAVTQEKPPEVSLDIRRQSNESLSKREKYLKQLIDTLNQPHSPLHTSTGELDSEYCYNILNIYVRENCYEMVGALLKKGAPSVFPNKQYSPFHNALLHKSPDPKMIEIFLKHDKNLATQRASTTEESPLALIIGASTKDTISACTKIVKLLLDYDVDPNASMTKADIIPYSNAMHYALRQGYLLIIMAILPKMQPLDFAGTLQMLVCLDKYHHLDLSTFHILAKLLHDKQYLKPIKYEEQDYKFDDLINIVHQIDTGNICSFVELESALTNSPAATNIVFNILNNLFYAFVKKIRNQAVSKISFEELMALKNMVFQYCSPGNMAPNEIKTLLKKELVVTSKEFFTGVVQLYLPQKDIDKDAIANFNDYCEELNYCIAFSTMLKDESSVKSFIFLLDAHHFITIRFLENYLSSSTDDVFKKDYYSLELLTLLKIANLNSSLLKDESKLILRARGVCYIIAAILTQEKFEIVRAMNFIVVKNEHKKVIQDNSKMFEDLNEWAVFKAIKSSYKLALKQPKNVQNTIPDEQQTLEINSDSPKNQSLASDYLIASEATIITTLPKVAIIVTPVTSETASVTDKLSLDSSDTDNDTNSDIDQEDDFESAVCSFDLSQYKKYIKTNTGRFLEATNFPQDPRQQVLQLFKLDANATDYLVEIRSMDNFKQWGYFELKENDFSASKTYELFFKEFKKGKPHFVTSDATQEKIATLWLTEDVRVFSREETVCHNNTRWSLIRFCRIGDHKDYAKKSAGLRALIK